MATAGRRRRSRSRRRWTRGCSPSTPGASRSCIPSNRAWCACSSALTVSAASARPSRSRRVRPARRDRSRSPARASTSCCWCSLRPSTSASSGSPPRPRSRSPSPISARAPSQSKRSRSPGSADLTAALDGGQPPRTLAPGETIGGTARFHAENLGAPQAQASLRASDGGPGILSLTGTGIGPVLQALPKSLFVGATALGTTRTAPVTVTNVGVDPKNVVPLVLTGVWIDGNDGTWAVQGGAMTVGPPGANIDLRVSFTPITTGVSHAALVIESNDGRHPHVEVPLAAIGRDLLPCKLAVLPGNPVDFGAQRVFVPIVEGYELVNQTADDCIVGEPE